MSVAEQMTETQERILSEVESAQDRMIEMNQRIAEAMTTILPGERYQLRSLPGMGELPHPKELVDTYFDFAAKMTEANRSFYKEMLEIWAPEQPAEEVEKKATKATKATKKTTKAKKA